MPKVAKFEKQIPRRKTAVSQSAVSNQRGRCARSAVHQGPLTVRILLAVRIAVIARDRRDRTRSEEKPISPRPEGPTDSKYFSGQSVERQTKGNSKTNSKSRFLAKLGMTRLKIVD